MTLKIIYHKYFYESYESRQLDGNIKKLVKEKIKNLINFCNTNDKNSLSNFPSIKKLSNNKYKIYEIKISHDYRLILIYQKDYLKEKRIILLDLANHDLLEKKNYYKNLNVNPTDLSNDDFIKEILGDSSDNFSEFITIKGLHPDFKIKSSSDETFLNFSSEDETLLNLSQENTIKYFNSKKLPMVIKGGAGVGKTKILGEILKRLTINPEFLVLYVTYNSNLINYFKNEILDQANLTNSVQIFSYNELCKFIIKNYSDRDDNFSESKKYDEILFRKDFKSKFKSKLDFNVNDFIIWKEIQNYIKGMYIPIPLEVYIKNISKLKTKSPNSPLVTFYIETIKNFYSFLDEKQKFKLSKKYNSDFLKFSENLLKIESAKWQEEFNIYLSYISDIKNNIKENCNQNGLIQERFYLNSNKSFFDDTEQKRKIYNLACYYQNYLYENNYWDDTDLSNEAYSLMMNNEIDKSYDYILADEIQDISYKQIYQLIMLSKNKDSYSYKIVITGDENQIIRAMSFDWGIINSIFYTKNNKITTETFNENMRSTKEITDLSNLILDIKHKFSKDDNKYVLKCNNTGELPHLFLDNDIFSEKNTDIFQKKDCKIIFFDNTLKEDFLNKYDFLTNHTLSINNVKGLEYKIVILYSFFNSISKKKIWEKFLDHLPDNLENFIENLEKSDKKIINFELSLLYIATTRARDMLFFYDIPENEKFYKIFGSNLIKSESSKVVNLIEHEFDIEVEERRKRAYSYMSNSEYSLAAKEFSILKDYNGQNLALALNSFYSKNYQNALEYFSKIPIENHQDENLLRIYAETLSFNKLYEKSGNLFFKLNEIEKATIEFEKGNNWKELCECYKILNNYDKLAEILDNKLNEKEKALIYYEKDGNYIKCAEICEILNKFDKAADFWVKAKNYKRSVELLYKINNIDGIYSLINYLNNLEEFELIGDIYYEYLKNKEKAVEFYKKSKSRTSTAKTLFLLEKFEEAGDVWASINEKKQAILCYEKCTSKKAKAKLNEIKNNKFEAYKEWRSVGEYDKAANNLKDFIYSLKINNEINTLKNRENQYEIISFLIEVYFVKKEHLEKENYKILFESINIDSSLLINYLSLLYHFNTHFQKSKNRDELLKSLLEKFFNEENTNKILGDFYFFNRMYEESLIHYHDLKNKNNEIVSRILLIKDLKSYKNSELTEKIDKFKKFQAYINDNLFEYLIILLIELKMEKDLKIILEILKGKFKKQDFKTTDFDYQNDLNEINSVKINDEYDFYLPFQSLNDEQKNKIICDIYMYFQDYSNFKNYFYQNSIEEAYMYYSNGSYEKAYSIVNKNIYFFNPPDLNKKIYKIGYHNLAMLNLKLLNFKEAGYFFVRNKEYNSALTCYEKLNYLKGKAYVYEKMENLKESLKYYHKELKNYKKALQLYKKMNDIDGMYNTLIELKRFDEAGNLMLNTGNVDKAKEAFKKSNSEYAKAYVSYFEQDYRNAAELFKKIGMFSLSAESYIKQKDFPSAIEMLKKDNKFIEAGNIFLEKLQNKKEALKLYCCFPYKNNPKLETIISILKDLKNYDELFKVYLYLRDFKNAKEVAEILGKKDLILKCLILLNDYEKIGDIYFQEKNFNNALIYYEKSNSITKIANTLIRLERYNEAGDIYYNSKDFNTALELFKKANNELKIAEISEQMGDYETAGKIFYKRGNYEKALDLFRKTKNLNLQAQCLYNLKQFDDAGDIYLKLNLIKEAKNCYKESSSDYAKAKFFELEGNWTESSKYYLKIKNFEKAKETSFKSNNFELIEKILVESSSFNELAEFYEKNDLKEKSFEIYYNKIKPIKTDKCISLAKELGKTEELIKLYKKEKKYLELSKLYIEIENYEEAANIMDQYLGQTALAANLCFEHGYYEKAIIYYEKLENTEKLIDCYIYNNQLEKAYNFCIAIKNYSKALEIAKQLKDKLKISDCEIKLGIKNQKDLKRKSEIINEDNKKSILNNFVETEDEILRKAKEFEKLGNYGKALDCYFKIRNHLKQAEMLEKLGSESQIAQAISIYEKNNRSDLADKVRKKYFKLQIKHKKYEKALKLEESENKDSLEKAIEIYSKFFYFKELRRAREKLKKLQSNNPYINNMNLEKVKEDNKNNKDNKETFKEVDTFYIAINGDNTKKIFEEYMAQDNEVELSNYKRKIDYQMEEIRKNLLECNFEIIIMGGDNILAKGENLTEDLVKLLLEETKKNYSFSIGIGKTLNQANSALKHAKSSGKKRLCLFDGENFRIMK